MRIIFLRVAVCAVVVAAGLQLYAQNMDAPADARMVERGNMVVNGKPAKYMIRRLPVSTFTNLPAAVAAELEKRGCMIPQSYQAHRAENVVHGSFEHAGTADWAVLCSAGGRVKLLVFFVSAVDKPLTLEEADEKKLLQIHDPSGVLGFAWDLDAATPEQVHEAQAGLLHRPAAPTHDAVELTWLDNEATYRLYDQGRWIELEMPD